MQINSIENSYLRKIVIINYLKHLQIIGVV